jgi:membrane protease YdiL (CAAX protease family)
VVVTPGVHTPFLPWWLALIEVVLVCGIPTQIVVAVGLLLIGVPLTDSPNLDVTNISLEFFATVSLVDTALIALLIRVFLAFSGETSRDVFTGMRPIVGEIWRGLVLIPVALIAVIAIVSALRLVAPWLHTVSKNPLEAYMQSPIDATIFIVVVMLAGGVREELTRAFILHRSAQRLGGIWVGLIAYSLLFGALHYEQGWDVAIAVGLLGVFWGVLYIKRRSVVMAMVNHAGFDATQVLMQLLLKGTGL